MSAVEISQEERDLWRFEASDNCGTPSDEDERILRLLEAFEACEADLERSCEETRANFSELYRMANEVVPELKKCIVDAEARAEKAEAERKKDLAHCKYEFERAEDAEAEVVRLTKMVDWLAGQLHGLGPKYGDVICPQEKCHATSDCIDCWKEAARRAVAAGEE